MAQLFSKEHYLRSAAPELSDAERARLLRPQDARLLRSRTSPCSTRRPATGDFESAGITVRGDRTLPRSASPGVGAEGPGGRGRGLAGGIGAQGVVTVSSSRASTPRRRAA
ncbi:hypothetical protein QJS66_06190 [Kocuria rhizophila]|nr:hypothetical protein QJS66_06190 [Kocuria rhizophila]